MGNDLRGRVRDRATSTGATPPPPRPESSVTEIATRDKPLVDLVRDMAPEFEKAAPKGVEAVQVVRDVLTAISRSPRLRECEPMSVLGGAMTMAQLGLRVGVLGHGWLLPFKDSRASRDAGRDVYKAQLVIGYKGYADLVTRSGMASDLGAHAVHRRDGFVMAFKDGRRIVEHDPDWWGDRGDLLGWFAAARVTGFDTYTFTEPWSVARMNAHRDAFAMGRDRSGNVVGPWRDNYESMAKKTVLLDLINLLPKSTDVARAIDADGSVRVNLNPDAIATVGDNVVEGEVVADTADAEREGSS